ncbi:MAG TPA: hypothetical protein VE690_07810 [Rhodopila sp.]|jgi:hypothetical protein|nr:hypothetical protein [Rhodopila sp.]
MLIALTCLPAASALLVATPVRAMPAAVAGASSRPASVVDVAARRHAGQNSVDTSQNAEVERLNQLSLERAQQGLNSPGVGSDTTATLNGISEGDAARGQNLGDQPIVQFR